MSREVPDVRRALVGAAVSIEAGYARYFGDKTYSDVCIIEFASREGLIAYLNHPIHDELGRLFWEISDSAIVMEAEMIDAKTEDISAFGLKT